MAVNNHTAALIISIRVTFHLSRVVVGRRREHVRKCLPLKWPR